MHALSKREKGRDYFRTWVGDLTQIIIAVASDDENLLPGLRETSSSGEILEICKEINRSRSSPGESRRMQSRTEENSEIAFTFSKPSAGSWNSSFYPAEWSPA